MKKIGLIFYLIISCLASFSFGSDLYAVFITSDGFRPDYVELYHPPNIIKLIKEGVRVKDAVGVFPWTTTTNMTSLVTGSYPGTTNIGNNSHYVKEFDKIVGGPRDNQAETIGETLEKAGIPTAAVNHFMLENRGAKIYRSVGYDNSKGTTDAILEILKNNQARFIAAIYGKTDSQGHKYGPFSKEMRETVLEVDKEIGRLVAALKEAGLYEKTLMVFSSDHGMSPFEKKQAAIEPAEALKQAGFKVATGQRDLKEDTELIVISSGSRIIYLRKPLTPERLQLFESTLKNIEGVELWDTEKLRKEEHTGPRSGDYAVIPKPGYAISNAGDPGGLHGRPTEKNTILILRGPGIKKDATVAKAENIDIVPTILHCFGVQPAKTVDGKIIQDAFVKKWPLPFPPSRE
ncbi:MAG: alkaline phosphatase family protein [bacterium]|nr:alkaline phosphatase family protein [bacterium]